jgi:hypothetical protein
MDRTKTDRFALAAFSLAFSIQRILESKHVAPEAKEKLTQDFAKLRERVTLLTKIRENKETATRLRQQTTDGVIRRPEASTY